MKVLLLGVSLNELHSWDIQGDQNEGESIVKRSIIDDLLFADMQRGKMEGEGGVTRSVCGELHSWDIQGDQNEGESGVNRSIIDDLLF